MIMLRGGEENLGILNLGILMSRYLSAFDLMSYLISQKLITFVEYASTAYNSVFNLLRSKRYFMSTPYGEPVLFKSKKPITNPFPLGWFPQKDIELQIARDVTSSWEQIQQSIPKQSARTFSSSLHPSPRPSPILKAKFAPLHIETKLRAEMQTDIPGLLLPTTPRTVKISPGASFNRKLFIHFEKLDPTIKLSFREISDSMEQEFVQSIIECILILCIMKNKEPEMYDDFARNLQSVLTICDKADITVTRLGHLGNALLLTLMDCLEDSFSKQLESSWRAVYSVLLIHVLPHIKSELTGSIKIAEPIKPLKLDIHLSEVSKVHVRSAREEGVKKKWWQCCS